MKDKRDIFKEIVNDYPEIKKQVLLDDDDLEPSKDLKFKNPETKRSRLLTDDDKTQSPLTGCRPRKEKDKATY